MSLLNRLMSFRTTKSSVAETPDKDPRDTDEDPDKMLSRVVILRGMCEGEEQETTFYKLPRTPKDTAEWEAKRQLQDEGWTDVNVVESEVRLHD